MTKTLQEELEAEFKKHDEIDAVQGANVWECRCGWRGILRHEHLAEVATRITNARVEGLIREAMESGFKIRKTYGTLEYGVAYTEKAGAKMTRVMSNQYSADNTKEDAEEFLKFWHDKGNEAFLVTRQWRAVE